MHDMNQEGPAQGVPVPPGIRLRQAGTGVWAVWPLDRQGQDAADLLPQPLTALGSKVFERCIGLCRAAQERQRTCLLVLLLLDLERGRWRHWVPGQVCARTGVRCSLAGQRIAGPLAPSVRLAGSVQSLAVPDAHELPQVLPGFDGLHAVVDTDFDSPGWWFFLRSGEQVIELSITQALVNEAEPLLEAARHRLTVVPALD